MQCKLMQDHTLFINQLVRMRKLKISQLNAILYFEKKPIKNIQSANSNIKVSTKHTKLY